MGRSSLNSIGVLLILYSLLQQPARARATSPSVEIVKLFSFNGFNDKTDKQYFQFVGVGENFEPIIRGGALQLTPDTTNPADVSLHYNKAGRIMYHKRFRLWSDDVVASFSTSFVINMHRNGDWDAGHGLAFLIAPNVSIPEASYGQWLGLTNESTDGNNQNQIVAIEFDTERQDFDPNDNHIGLNLNSVKSTSNVSLDEHNITLSQDNGIKYQTWIQYNGSSKQIEVYMVEEGQSKPQRPLLNETINLKDLVKQDSYLGFAASTGQPQIELNCVRNWTLHIQILPLPGDDRGWVVAVGVGAAVAVLLILFMFVFVHTKKRGREGEEDPIEFGRLRLPGMPREYKYKDLKKATNNFDVSMKLGKGGFGIVYKGVLRGKDHDDNGPREIAVKKFIRDNIKSKDDFMAELAIIHRLRHKHLVRLVGN